jgi:Transcriptional regulator, AbiEi antitoxin
MQTRQALRAVAPTAETQRGLVTSSQAARVGVPRLDLSRMAGTGDLERITHGVYRIVGADEDEYTDVYAHWLALDPERTAAERIADRGRIIAVSHRSAARIYGMGDLPVTEHTYTSSYRKQTQRPGVHAHGGRLTRDDVRVEHGMLVTTPERTIADLRRTEPDTSHVANALADAINDRRTSRAKVIAAVPGRSEGARTRDVDRLLALRGLDTSSLSKELVASLGEYTAVLEGMRAVAAAVPHLPAPTLSNDQWESLNRVANLMRQVEGTRDVN